MPQSLNKPSSLLSVSDIRHQYGDKTVLSIDTWHLMKHEHQMLLGPSGSGKTTLLGILSGLLKPTSGSVAALGTTQTDLSETDLSTFRARNFGFVFQNHHLISNLSVEQNLILARHLAELPNDTEWIAYLLNHLGLSEYKNSKPNHLSQGEKQRAAIARAAATKPPLLLADEPTSSLDDNNAFQFIELLKTLSEEIGSTILVASHDSRITPFFPKSLSLMNTKEETS